MERRRFFAEISNGYAWIRGEEAYHLSVVLRLKEGDMVELLTSEGIWIGQIVEVLKGEVKVSLLERKKVEALPFDVLLFQGVTKGKRIDWLVQKAAELGCKAFYPMVTRYTVVSEVGDEKLKRWRKISQEASKQCGRPDVMEVMEPISFEEAITLSQQIEGLKVAPCLRGSPIPLREVLLKERKNKVLFFIGPEGGFSPEEVASLISSGFKTVTLGPYILKSETASLMVLSTLLALWG
ncbi:MAG: rRNA (uracil1498-N3)-methyltransferase [bacterium]|nr:MAG: Ribosomal RNA small subunit methyltransferase E [bacterium 42_11]MDK2872121.1 rRNA (uracil1498-N3)-methyltransferase [bacterium]